MRWFRSSPPGDSLAVTMTGVRMGDRLLVLGCGDPTLVAQLGLKPGLTGRTCAVDPTEAGSARAAQAAIAEGALIETETAPLIMLPYNTASFDVVVMNHSLSAARDDQRQAILNEARRVLREGGRCVAVEAAARGGLARLMGGPQLNSADIERLFQLTGYRAVRTLAEREGLAFIEGTNRN